MSAYQRIIDKYPNNAIAYFMMGVCKTFSGEAEQALSLFETSLRRDPLFSLRYTHASA
jgi:hypothetical protein